MPISYDYKTYSFQDVTASFSCTGVGAKSSTGAGIGSITTAMAQTKTTHDIAADGRVMISKVLGENGTVTITIQQNSELHAYLIDWYNYISSSNTIPDWAAMTITIHSPNLDETTTCTGVSPQKMADQPYQAQGQMVSWALMAAKIIRS